jgi:undecaprenyl diphosphate synthase
MIDKNNIPKHIAIIMDGNGRWANERGLPRTAGHRKGIERIKEILKAANELGIRFITFFTFSTENWQRPKREVDMLMHSLDNFLKNQVRELNQKNIRLMVIGEKEPLPHYLQKRIKQVQDLTKENNGLVAIIALNYGSRQEIINAVKRFSEQVRAGKETIDNLSQELFANFLYTAGIPDPDLLIRTSAELRISNFLLWQLSYAELYFPKKYWPDFSREDLIRAIKEYQRRERRFGGIEVAKKDA